MSPPKTMQLTHIDEFAHGAIGLGGVELYLALETDCLYDEF